MARTHALHRLDVEFPHLKDQMVETTKPEPVEGLPIGPPLDDEAAVDPAGLRSMANRQLRTDIDRVALDVIDSRVRDTEVVENERASFGLFD